MAQYSRLNSNKRSKEKFSLSTLFFFLCSIVSVLFIFIWKVAQQEEGSFTGISTTRSASTARQEGQPSNTTPGAEAYNSLFLPVHDSTGGLDCRALLLEFRDDKIQELAQNPLYGKPYVTKTINPKPFYWSTHHPEIDLTRQSSYLKGQYYETQLSQRIIDIFNEKSKEGKEAIMLDVGGNIGWFSLLAAAHGATKVYTFEPNPANLVRFCESLQLNDWLRDDPLEDRVVPMAKGMSDQVGVHKLFRAEQNNPGSATFSKERFLNTVKKRIPNEEELNKHVVGEMELETLDHFAENMGWFDTKPEIAFFKLDVEGLEPAIVYGGERFFQARIVEYFAFETKPKRMSSKDKYDMLNIIFNSGYDLYMHGGYKGPYHLVTTTYKDYKDLASDICAGKYGHNLLFRRRESWSQSSN